jgi:hypothetical protein
MHGFIKTGAVPDPAHTLFFDTTNTGNNQHAPNARPIIPTAFEPGPAFLISGKTVFCRSVVKKSRPNPQ